MSYASEVLADTPLVYYPLSDVAATESLQLLIDRAGTNATAIAYDQVTLNGLTLNFTTAISAGDGVAVMFLDPAQETPASIGGFGGSAGYNGLAGSAFRIDTFASVTKWLSTTVHGGTVITQNSTSGLSGTGSHTWSMTFTKTAPQVYTVVVIKDGAAWTTYPGVTAPDVVFLGFGAADGSVHGTVVISAVTSSPALPFSSREWSLNSSDIDNAFWVTDSTLVDASGNAHNGTYSGLRGFNRVTGVGTNTRATLFDGIAGSAVTSFNLPSAMTAISIERWSRQPSTAFIGKRIIANSHTDVDHNGFQINEGGTGREHLGLGLSTGAVDFQATGSPPSGTAMHQHVWTYDGAQVIYYVDGAPIQTFTGVTGTLNAAAFGIGLAYNPAYSGDFWPGLLGDVSIYSTALSGARVAAHFNARVNGLVARVGGTTANTLGTAGNLASLPQSATLGNLLLASVAIKGFGGFASCATPAGWTLAATDTDSAGGNTVAAFLFYRVAVGGETSVSLTVSGASGGGEAITEEWSGLSRTSPLRTAAVGNGATTPVTSQAGTAGDWVFSAAATQGTATIVWIAPAVADAPASSNFATVATGRSAVAATGTQTMSATLTGGATPAVLLTAVFIPGTVPGTDTISGTDIMNNAGFGATVGGLTDNGSGTDLFSNAGTFAFGGGVTDVGSLGDVLPPAGTTANSGSQPNDFAFFTDAFAGTFSNASPGTPAPGTFGANVFDAGSFADNLTISVFGFTLDESATVSDDLGIQHTASFVSSGRTTFLAGGVVYGFFSTAGFTTTGRTTVTAFAVVDGVTMTGFLVLGTTHPSFTPAGTLLVNPFTSSGSTTFAATLTGPIVTGDLAATFNGATRFFVIYRQPPNDIGGSEVATSANVPIGIGVELTGHYTALSEVQQA